MYSIIPASTSTLMSPSGNDIYCFCGLTLDHVILLKKLNYYGIRATELAWYKSYLIGRKYVFILMELIVTFYLLPQGFHNAPS